MCSDVEKVKESFSNDGFVVLRQKIPLPIIEAFESIHGRVFGSIFAKLHENGHASFPVASRTAQEGIFYTMGLGVKNGFREIVMRSPGRFEISLLDRIGKDVDNCLVQDLMDCVADVAPSLLGEVSWNNVKISNLSFVVATPESSEQSWHADGGHVNLHEHLPCHVFNAFIPLSSITMTMGPTQIRPGSHVYTRNLAPMLLVAKARKNLRTPVAPLLDKGDALVFDYRVLHRGLANTSLRNRTILVLTLSKTWFQDVLNFPSRSINDIKDEDDDVVDNKEAD